MGSLMNKSKIQHLQDLKDQKGATFSGIFYCCATISYIDFWDYRVWASIV